MRMLALVILATVYDVNLNKDSSDMTGDDDTVDGWNPAPVDMVNIPSFTRLYTSQVVVWDFFHQQ